MRAPIGPPVGLAVALSAAAMGQLDVNHRPVQPAVVRGAPPRGAPPRGVPPRGVPVIPRRASARAEAHHLAEVARHDSLVVMRRSPDEADRAELPRRAGDAQPGAGVLVRIAPLAPR